MALCCLFLEKHEATKVGKPVPYLTLTLPKCRFFCEVDYQTIPSVVGHRIFCPLFFLLLVVVVMCLMYYIRYHRYCNFLVLNCRTISRSVPILLNTSSLVIFSVHDIFNTLRYFNIAKTMSARHNIRLLSIWSSGLCLGMIACSYVSECS